MSVRMRLFPLNAVLFPGATLNLHVFEARYKQLLAECLDAGEGFGVALIAEGQEAGDPEVTPHEVGAMAEIVEVSALPFGRYYVSTVGRSRFRIVRVVAREPFLVAEVEPIEEDGLDDAALRETAEAVRALFAEYVELSVRLSGRAAGYEIRGDARDVSFLVADALQIGERVKQRLLEEDRTQRRLEMERSFLERALPQMRAMAERRRERPAYRVEQERYFGTFFSEN